jgi:hypothetical protein
LDPNPACDLLYEGAFVPKRCCIICSHCTRIMHKGGCPGCVVFDGEVYAPIYRAGGRCSGTEQGMPAQMGRKLHHGQRSLFARAVSTENWLQGLARWRI